MALIFVFLDGIGLAPPGPTNPLTDAATPFLHELLGGPLTTEVVQTRAQLCLRPIDATLGVAGLPQSGTGHVALLTGLNAAHLIGRHMPHYPPVVMRAALAEQSIFRRVRAAGGRVAFANVFPPAYWQALATRRLRRSASVIAAEGAGVRLRDLADLRAGRALTWDITGAAMHARGEALDLPLLDPYAAGRRLAALAAEYELVFFECFLPDLAGHGRFALEPAEVMARIDALLAGVCAACGPADNLLVTSDHGNLEDCSLPIHTRNPVPLLVVGSAAAHFSAVVDLTGVAAALLATCVAMV